MQTLPANIIGMVEQVENATGVNLLRLAPEHGEAEGEWGERGAAAAGRGGEDGRLEIVGME